MRQETGEVPKEQPDEAMDTDSSEQVKKAEVLQNEEAKDEAKTETEVGKRVEVQNEVIKDEAQISEMKSCEVREDRGKGEAEVEMTKMEEVKTEPEVQPNERGDGRMVEVMPRVMPHVRKSEVDVRDEVSNCVLEREDPSEVKTNIENSVKMEANQIEPMDTSDSCLMKPKCEVKSTDAAS